MMAAVRAPEVHNASALAKVRYWLIRRLAGRTVVVLNAKLQLKMGLPGERHVLRINTPKGALICDCDFHFAPDEWPEIHLSQSDR